MDAVGTMHFAHWVAFENNHVGFFTVFDGDLEKYIQDFADKMLGCLRYYLSTCQSARRQPQ